MDNPEVLKFFPSPVFKFRFEKFRTFNEELSNYIYKLYEEDSKGVDRSNRGGWHSKTFELNDKNSIQLKFALELQKYILKTFTNLGWKTENQNIRIREMWAIINKKDDFNVVHTHPNSLLSAAYYVKAPNNCGRFQIEDLNIVKRHASPLIANQNELNMNVAGLEVTEGDLLIFPGYLPHKVARNETDDDRIVISFNVDIK
tara:strand:+ start:914 stop:1516 length:603 start_codon:yes stop_codon:yes gene_type:complete